MATITFNNPKFDTVEYIKRLRNAGATQELATKQDLDIVKLELQKEIKSAEIKLMLLMGAGFASILGVLAKGFHWF